jgi:hypothetical protein
MSDGSPVSARLDARMLADLREWRARVDTTSTGGNRWSARLTVDEFDMLLRVADDRDALRRELCEMPDDVTLAPKLPVAPVCPCDGCGRGLDRWECNA